MNMKKVIAAALVIGTMVMTGTALAGSRFHGGQHGRGGFGGQRWEQRGPHYEIPRRHTESWNNRRGTFKHNRHVVPQQHHRHERDMMRMRGWRRW